VLVSEQVAMSIKVTVAPHISGGLAALAEEHLSRDPAEAAPKDRTKGRATISNQLVGDIHGTVLQIGTVKNMNTPEGR
jgi:hypothetical protein